MSRWTGVPAADPLSLLDSARRSRDLEALAAGAPVDVLVVGGGVTGAGVALDAATRGLRVALVERHDLAHGTSRWSSKLVHGGLRYLAKGDVAVAWESAVERDLIMRRVAPHLVATLPQLVPTTTSTTASTRALTGAGLRAADALRRAAGTPTSVLPSPHRVDRDRALAMAPALDPDEVVGGWVTYDGRLEDDARLVVALARTAAAYGARVLTRVEVVAHADGAALLRDTLDGGELVVKARRVVNATGVWAGGLDPSVHVLPSRGTHLVLRASTLGHPTAALTTPVPGSTSRFVFAVPQPDDDLVYLGLTDVAAPGAVPEVPVPDDDEIDWLLATASGALARPLTRADVVGSFAGLRPLLSPSSGQDSHEDGAEHDAADVSRRHAVIAHDDGLITVTGGKLTTYRRMAADTVDLVTTRPARTRDIGLVGAAGPRDPGAPPARDRFERRFGTEHDHVRALADGDPAMLEPLVEGVTLTGAEVLWAVRAEGALDVDDVLERRSRVALVPADAARVRAAVTDLVAGAMIRG